MRRPTQDEALHGTRHGQLTLDAELKQRYSLTDREGAVAALLTKGLTGRRIAEQLEISASTAEKHLGSLRKKLGVQTTTEAAATVARFSIEQAGGVPGWPVAPVGFQAGLHSGRSQQLASALEESADVDSAVDALRDHLAEDGVEALYFVFLPMSAFSFRTTSYIEGWAAPRSLVDAHAASGGFSSNPLALQIFAEPDRQVFLDASDPATFDGMKADSTVVDACRSEGLPLCLAFAGPFGCGFVGTAMFFGDDARHRLTTDGEALVPRLRSALMLTQSAMFARGILAKTASLTLRERNALTLVAQGLGLRAAAQQLGTGERVLAKLLKSARTKLGAATNTEAVSRAMALNALVFL